MSAPKPTRAPGRQEGIQEFETIGCTYRCTWASGRFRKSNLKDQKVTWVKVLLGPSVGSWWFEEVEPETSESYLYLQVHLGPCVGSWWPEEAEPERSESYLYLQVHLGPCVGSWWPEEVEPERSESYLYLQVHLGPCVGSWWPEEVEPERSESYLFCHRISTSKENNFCSVFF